MANQPYEKASCLSLLTSILGMTAFILMWIGSVRCNFIKFTDISGSASPLVREFGIWYYQSWASVVTSDGAYIVMACMGYPDSIELDSSWKAARAFSVITLIFAVIIITIKVSAAALLKR